MKETTYSIGEIHRLGLLKNREGEPYKDKATVSKELRLRSAVPDEVIETKFGTSKRYSKATLDSLNAGHVLPST